MHLILVIIAVVVVVALLVWATDYLTIVAEPFRGLVKFLWIVLGVLIIIQQAGLLR